MKWFRTEPPAVVSGTAKRKFSEDRFLNKPQLSAIILHIAGSQMLFCENITEVPDVNKNAVCTWCGMAKRPHIN